MKKIPKSQPIKSKYRKDLWQNANKILAKIEKVLPISSVHLLGSFTTKKRRPADVDFIVMVHTSDNKDAKWALDIVITPDNRNLWAYAHSTFVFPKFHGNYMFFAPRKTPAKFCDLYSCRSPTLNALSVGLRACPSSAGLRPQYSGKEE